MYCNCLLTRLWCQKILIKSQESESGIKSPNLTMQWKKTNAEIKNRDMAVFSEKNISLLKKLLLLQQLRKVPNLKH